jgi:hypothetical protein
MYLQMRDGEDPKRESVPLQGASQHAWIDVIWSIQSSKSVQLDKRCRRKTYTLVDEVLLSTRVIHQDFNTMTSITTPIFEASSISNSLRVLIHQV